MPKLTLSFDNGPEPEVTPAVLDALRRRGLKATFFVLGHKLREPARRALAERSRDEGHWIGNHTFSHATPLGERSEPNAPELEIGRAQEALGALAHADRFFRPNGGGGNLDRRLLSRRAVDYLVEGGYSCVLWNSIPRDWADPEGWVERALAQCAAQDWTLTVLHDLPTGAMRRLDAFLDELEARGIELRQDFPPDCMPIRSGQVAAPLDAYVTP
jgi:peptidoglycan/xylan/chitin deacetylase (PgdA/CDA1 family)